MIKCDLKTRKEALEFGYYWLVNFSKLYYTI
jgi:hypothetical protein